MFYYNRYIVLSFDRGSFGSHGSDSDSDSGSHDSDDSRFDPLEDSRRCVNDCPAIFVN